jgi:putative ABC transport system permease protein
VTWFTVVGVVRDVRQAGLHAQPGTEVYVTHRQAKLLLSEWVPRDMTIVAKADAARLPELTRRLPALVRDADRSLALSGLTSMDAAVGRTMAEPRATALLLSGFAAAAMLLAAIGIYGVISFSVGQRAGEFAVRIALGATPASVVRLVVGQASLPIAAGLAIGCAGAVATTRLLRSLLFEITPTDPPTFAGALLFLVSVALAACWIPARRATRTDPITALRNI